MKSFVLDQYEWLLRQTGLLGQFTRKWRRFFFGVFREDYIKKNIEENREGECHRCGACCKLLFNCPFLGNDGDDLPYCRIYGNLRPTNCHNYPFDKKDSEIKICGFRFKD